MSEIRIKQKTFGIGVALTLLLLFYLASRSPKCASPPVINKIVPVTSHEHISASGYNKVKSIEPSLPFTVYAITPTYARPVQKAELTRYTYD